MAQTSNSRRTAQLHVGGRCELKCAVCDCRDAREERDVERRLAGGGRRLTLRGVPAGNPRFFELAARGADAGFAEINARTSGIGFDDPQWLARFASSGVTDVSLPLFASSPKVHDTVAGRAGALVETLYGARALHGAGLGVTFEIPLLPSRLQDLTATVELAVRAVPALRAIRFFAPLGRVPDVIAPPRWDEGALRLAAALRAAEAHGVPVSLQTADGIPLCALPGEDSLHRLFRFDPRGRASVPGARKDGPCSGCLARAQCPGVVESYYAAHGTDGVVPFDRRPKTLFEQRTTPSRVWTDEQRRSAAAAELLVLRPTVNCNQDCPFCSANESSNNIWTDHQVMYRQIARAAQRGIPRVSFGGGEPTLSKHLVSFVRVAKRCGMREVEIVSNGALLDRRDRVDALVDAGLTDAFISLHAHTERLSRMMTHKVGDFDRTVQAIHHLLDRDVRIVLNHVIGERNYRYLTRYLEFVRSEFGGRVGVSLAYMTPQFKALTNIDLVPRMSDVMPYLKRAMYRALEIQQSVHIGARQGVPPCLLGEFRAWSDILSTAEHGIAEDQPQKQRGPQCDRCQYTNLCTGLWRPYVARFGTDELTPIERPPLSREDARMLRSERTKPFSFDAFPDVLRSRELEIGPPTVVTPDDAALPELTFDRTRPLRMALIGTGLRARRIVADAHGTPGVSFDAIASPHAPDGDLTDFAHAPAYRDADQALDEMRPDAVVIASATHAHAANIESAAARGIPALVEKPPTRTLAEGDALAASIAESGALVMVAHNVLFAAGLDTLWARVPSPARVSLVARTSPMAPSAVRTWHAEGLFQSLYHTVALLTRSARSRSPRVVDVQFTGDSRPETLRFALEFDRCVVDALLDHRASGDELALTLTGADGASSTWRRAAHEVTLTDARGVPTPVERRGNEIARMLAAFALAIDQHAPSPVPLEEGLDVMRTTSALIEALERAGAPFSDAVGPKHVASKPLISDHHRPSRRASPGG
ncbi:MAG: radical SAM protein [Myxococcales bacterium]|nr:radical SAM protein [Myxococcales bacterium]MCB9532143.1 radical SAM protein [Myxococcales bacterium]